MSATINYWLEVQRIKGGPHGFECIGIIRMQQVWEAAREDLLQQLSTAQDENDELRQQLAASKEELSRARLKNAIVYGTSHPEIYKTKEDELRQQVTLLREPLLYIDEVAKTSKTIISVAAAAMKMLKKIRAALAATKEQ